MYRILFVASIFLVGLGQAEAVCPTKQITGNNKIKKLLSNKTVCVRGSGDWEAQEIHAANGSLSDYKKGSDPVDPTVEIGYWEQSGDTVHYSYSGGSSFSYDVYYSSPNICFVNSTTTVEGTLVGGPGCGGF